MKQTVYLTALLTAFCLPALHAEEVKMLSDTEKSKLVAPFPAAKEKTTRHVIFLPVLDNESDKKVELAIGKTLEVDCNRHNLMGQLEEKNLQGWGYTYYELDKVTGPVSTMMACINPEKTKKFVTINTDKLYRYNSKLPIVVYTPDDVKVKYRIWSATEEWQDAK